MLSGEKSFGPLSSNIVISVNKIVMYNSSLTLLKNFAYVKLLKFMEQETLIKTLWPIYM